MSRPTGWAVVDQGFDPVPGDPTVVRMMAREYQRISEAADDATTRLRSVRGSGWLTDWQGEAADVFVRAIQDTPTDLAKLVHSYADVATALLGWADVVDHTQYRADGALADAKDAAGDLDAARHRLDDAQATAAHYAATASRLTALAAAHPAGSPPPAGAEVPTPAQLRAASDNAAVASDGVDAAQSSITAAQSRIDAAKRLVAEARGDWEDGERRTATAIGHAADAGLGKQSVWDEVFQSEVWSDIVSVAKVVVAVGGVIALIVGGPIAWIVAGVALLVLADTVYKMTKGQADGWDLAFAALDCIPMGKGITTAARVGEEFAKGAGLAGGIASAGRHVGSEVVNTARSFTALPHLVANVRHGTALRSVESLRAFVVAGLPAGVRDVRNARGAFRDGVEAYWRSDLPSVAARARHWQGTTSGWKSGYPGVDPWRSGRPTSIVGQRLQVVGNGEFYVMSEGPAHDLITTGGDAAQYAASVQVGVHDASGPFQTFRPQGETYLVTQPLPHAIGSAVANPQYGAGGASEVFIPGDRSSWGTAFQSIDRPLMDPASVHPLPGTLRMEEYGSALRSMGVGARGLVVATPWDYADDLRHHVVAAQ
ncbi:WXG100 family type VII secretion target [Curtobacterium sp. MCBD17_028]|uniref:WXG100 family type VII secretion target n=1 Tax=Curtobacterium sp. MCBD17_028 TaxID=2175670 RepID=UPI000DA9FF25|nr:hypothetical protein [Curtobacterium sp. MCBD17_028]PZE28044.1 hypothetical protein DEI86_05510 [Curtobacterium sp. MCBD17_028]